MIKKLSVLLLVPSPTSRTVSVVHAVSSAHITQLRECPYCEHPLNAAQVVGEEYAEPKPGDVSVCGVCAGIILFTEDGIRSVSEEEEALLLKEVKHLLQAKTMITEYIKMYREVQGPCLN